MENETKYTPINTISEEEREALKRLTAYYLPDVPTGHNLKPADIKAMFWKAFVEGDASVVGLLNRVVKDFNKSFDDFYETFREELEEITAGALEAAQNAADDAAGAATEALNNRFAGKYREDKNMNLYSGDSAENTGGNGDDVVTGKCNAILNSGGGNKVTGDHNLVSGALNTVDAENCLVNGIWNEARLVKKMVNDVEHTYGHRATLLGRGLISNANDQVWTGRWNEPNEGVLFGVGAGTSNEERFTAFRVYPKGTATVGHDPIGAMDVVTKHLLDDANAATVAARAGLSAADARISRNDKRLTNLEKGISPDPYVTDDSEAYIKIVPNNALPYAEIENVGGEVTVIESHGKNLVNPAAFSSAVLSPEGVTHQGVTIKYLPDEDCFLIDGTNAGGDDGGNATQVISQYFAVKNVPGANYILHAEHISGTLTGTEAYFFVGVSDKEGNRQNWLSLQFATRSSNTKQNDYALITAFWFYLYKGVSFDNYKVRFQLERGTTATEYSKYKALVDSKTIPQIDAGDDLIEVEAGGSLVFVNENGLEVPSTVTYMVKEDKV